MTQFKVLQCERCGMLTYKRLDFKTVRCPSCQAKMESDPIQIFENVREAVKFIQAEKLRRAPKAGDWFERFGWRHLDQIKPAGSPRYQLWHSPARWVFGRRVSQGLPPSFVRGTGFWEDHFCHAIDDSYHAGRLEGNLGRCEYCL